EMTVDVVLPRKHANPRTRRERRVGGAAEKTSSSRTAPVTGSRAVVFHPRMATGPSQSAADILVDGRNVLSAAKANAKPFKAYDAGRKKKVLDPAILTRLAANLAAAKKAGGAV